MATIVILAMICVFVGLRLWSVLGRRTGHEQPLPKADRVLAPRAAQVTVPSTEIVAASPQEQAIAPAAATGLRAIAAADPQFDAVRFAEGRSRPMRWCWKPIGAETRRR